MADSTFHIDETTPSPDKGKPQASSRDRDSGVFLSDSEDSHSPSIPSQTRPHAATISATSAPTPTSSDSVSRRLRRPTELNLSAPGSSNASKPKAELELRFDQIRNSQTRRKATLKSPTQLLHDRLNLSPKKEKEEKIRIFTPPRPMLNGCILPAPQTQLRPFQGSSVRARTEKGRRPAWWCKVDKLVVFDGIEDLESGEVKAQTRSSKGLSIARRRGDLETIIIPLDCTHCQEMLNRHEWKYDVQVCKRSVCWDCKERCRWEMEESSRRAESGESEPELEEAREVNRERADSVLQGQQAREEELCEKAGIEMGERSPVAVVGIEETLDIVEM